MTEPGQQFAADVAGRYDEWYKTRWGAYADQREKQLLLQLAAPRPGERVLDVGCGSGRYLVWLRQMGLSATGVERSAAMAHAAQARLAAQPIAPDSAGGASADTIGGASANTVGGASLPRSDISSTVGGGSPPRPDIPGTVGGASPPRHTSDRGEDSGVLIADGYHLPFADNTFDLVTSITVLEFAGEPGQFLSEMARVSRSRLFLGVLNKSSLYYLQQRRREGSIISKACFFSVGELLALIRETLGPVPIHWRTTLLGPATNIPILHTLTRCLDCIPGPSRLPWGAYIGVCVGVKGHF